MNSIERHDNSLNFHHHSVPPSNNPLCLYLIHHSSFYPAWWTHHGQWDHQHLLQVWQNPSVPIPGREHSWPWWEQLLHWTYLRYMLVCPLWIGGGYTRKSLLRSKTAERKAGSKTGEAEPRTGKAELRTGEAKGKRSRWQGKQRRELGKQNRILLKALYIWHLPCLEQQTPQTPMNVRSHASFSPFTFLATIWKRFLDQDMGIFAMFCDIVTWNSHMASHSSSLSINAQAAGHLCEACFCFGTWLMVQYPIEQSENQLHRSIPNSTQILVL